MTQQQVEQNVFPYVRIRGRTTAASTLDDRLAHHRVPGASVAVIADGEFGWASGYGVADVDSGAPVTAETLFQAGSISKPVTAVAALRLVERGLLSLDGDISESLSSWSIPNNEFTRDTPVTVRGILSHTAGLTVHGFPGYGQGETVPSLRQVLDGEAPANTPPVIVDPPPTAGFRYSGGGTTVLQQAMIDATGMTFPNLMEELVLGPLGMKASTFVQPLPDEMRRSAAAGHSDGPHRVAGAWHTYPEMAAAGLWTTPTDLTRFVLAVQAAAAGAPGALLGGELAEEMLTLQPGSPTGLGLFLDGTDQATRFWHAGGNAGFQALLVGYRAEGIGAVAMINSDAHHPLTGEIMQAVAEAYGWPARQRRERTFAEVDVATREALCGQYLIPDEGEVTVSLTDQGLEISAGRMTLDLLPESATAYFEVNVNQSIDFERDEEGRPILVIHGPTDIRARRSEDIE